MAMGLTEPDSNISITEQAQNTRLCRQTKNQTQIAQIKIKCKFLIPQGCNLISENYEEYHNVQDTNDQCTQ